MKKCYLFLTLGLIFTANSNAQYCTPPSFLSGPFTAIKEVSFGGMVNESGISDGYSDYTESVDPVNVSKGSTVTFDYVLHYDPALVAVFSGSVNLRVWIDWNQDLDFDDPGEQVITEVSTQTGEFTSFSYSFDVPASALDGETRMRVYEDMLVEDGHETPNPCGYATGVGQHGECEDYAIVVNGGAAGIESSELTMDFSIFPNPSTSVANIQFNWSKSEQVQLRLYDLFGKEVYASLETLNNGVTIVSIDTKDIAPGTYLLNVLASDGRSEVRKMIVE